MRVRAYSLVEGQIFRFIDSFVEYVVIDVNSTFITISLLDLKKYKRIKPYICVEIFPYNEVQLSLL